MRCGRGLVVDVDEEDKEDEEDEKGEGDEGNEECEEEGGRVIDSSATWMEGSSGPGL